MTFETTAVALIILLIGVELAGVVPWHSVRRASRVAYLAILPLLGVLAYKVVAIILPILSKP